MKAKTILSLLGAMLVQLSMAQSLVVTESDSIVYGNAYSSSDIEAHITVMNTSSSSIDVKVKRRDVNYTALTDNNAICWDVCFAPSVSNSPTSINLKAGASSSQGAFVGHVYPDMDGVPYTSPITYVFYDANNPTDSVEAVIYYSVSPTFSINEQGLKAAIRVYPNPATDLLKVEYDLSKNTSGTFEIINVVGNKVYHKNLDSRKGNFAVNLSNMSRGVYFYLVKSNGKVISTRKLVIQ